LPAGSYVVEVAHGLVKASETVEVKAKGATRSAVALQAGAIRVTATLQNGTPALDQAVFAISDVPAGTAAARTVWSGGADAPPVILPAGTWRISAELDRASHRAAGHGRRGGADRRGAAARGRPVVPRPATAKAARRSIQ
jgi:hypothetical protein